jgi:cysteine desulfurase family protein (TIGR01976 family)
MEHQLPTFDVNDIRGRFPALGRSENGEIVAYLDGPGGTQVPRTVIDSIARVLEEGVSNLGGGFGSSRVAVRVTSEARSAVADLLACDTDEVMFGQNMTSLTFAMSRALAAGWEEGDAIVLTSLDHDANFTPWAMAAAERGVDLRVAEFDTATGELDPGSVIDLIDHRTRLVAVCLSSNALGTLVDVAPISEAASQVGALTYVDAVHAAPHHLIDVGRLGCDFLAVSIYKLFGPHTGALFGRTEHLERIGAYKVRPAPDKPPGKFETGTQAFESLAGVTAAVGHIASLGSDGATRRGSIEMAYQAIGLHETSLATRFTEGLENLERVRLYGPPSPSHRSPTFALAIEGRSAAEVAKHMIGRGIYVWAGHYYALNVMERLGVLDSGGLVRIGFCHYNTNEEVDRALEALSEL